jgi:hypothetical protein
MKIPDRVVALKTDFLRLIKFSHVGVIGAVINTWFLWLFTVLMDEDVEPRRNFIQAREGRDESGYLGILYST